jgi:hypothetical protein
MYANFFDHSNFAGKSEIELQRIVPITELLTPSFVSSCSLFEDAQQLFDESGFKINSEEDIAAIPDNSWDQYISKKTIYRSWSDMLGAASIAWSKQQFGL